MPQRILGLDLALISGFAWNVDGGGYATRVLDLGKKGQVDSHLAKLDAEISALIQEIQPSVIVVENDTGRGPGARTLQSYHAVARMLAARNGIRFLYMRPTEARKLAIGVGIADKDRAQSLARAVMHIPLDAGSDETDACILVCAAESLLNGEARIAAAKAALKADSKRPKRRRVFADSSGFAP